MDLLIGRRVAIEGEGGQRAQQPGPGAAVQREHGAGETRPPLHVEQLQGQTDLPVRLLLVVQPHRLGRPARLPGPPTANLDVVGLAGPIGHLVGRDVGQVEETLADLFPFGLGLGRCRALVVTEAAALRAELLRPRLVAGPFGLTHGAAEHLDLGPDGLGACQEGPVSHVGGDHRVYFGDIDATTGECRLDPVGIFAQHADIDHACSK
jgi:hypothetical protein